MLIGDGTAAMVDQISEKDWNWIGGSGWSRCPPRVPLLSDPGAQSFHWTEKE